MVKASKKLDTEETSSYLILHGLEDDFPVPSLATTLDEAEAIFRKRNSKGRKKTNSDKEKSKDSDFSSLIDRAIEAFLPYYDLASFSKVLGPTMARVIVHDATVERKADFEIIKETNSKAIYGLTEIQLEQVSSSVERAMKLRNSFEVVSDSVLLSIVATYDAHIGSIARFSLLNTSDRIIKSEKTYRAKDIFKCASFEELLENIVDDEVHLILWESHQKQIEKIEALFNIEIINNFPYWGSFIETFERRNLVAHGIKNASSRYVSFCESAKCPVEERLDLGDLVALDPVYLRKSADILLLFIIVLIWNIWIKQNKKDFNKAFEKINEVSFDLITEGRNRLASRLLEIMINWKKNSLPERARRMMVINLANAYKFLDEKERSIDTLNIYE